MEEEEEGRMKNVSRTLIVVLVYALFWFDNNTGFGGLPRTGA